MNQGTKIAISSILAVGSIAVVAPGAAFANDGTTTSNFVVDDTKQLNVNKAVTDINADSYPNNMHIAVLFSSSSAFTKDNFDNDVKSYAMHHFNNSIIDTEHNDLMPNTMLIAIDPKIHKMGLYGGPETNINQDLVDKTTNNMRKYAERSDWNGMVSAAAATISSDAMPQKDNTDDDQGTASQSSTKHINYMPIVHSFLLVVALSSLVYAIICLSKSIMDSRRKNVMNFYQKKKAAKTNEKKRAAMLTWNGPGKETTDAALAEWSDIQAKYEETGFTLDDKYAHSVKLLQDYQLQNYQLQENQKLDEHFVRTLRDSVSSHAKGTASPGSALQTLNELVDERDFKDKKGPRWQSIWADKLSKAANLKIQNMYKQLSGQVKYLDSKDYDAISAMLAKKRVEIEKIDDKVLHSDMSTTEGLQLAEKAVREVQQEIKNYLPKAKTKGSPSGKRRRRDTSDDYLYTNNDFTFTNLLWVTAASNNSYSHSSHSSYNNSSSSSSSYDSSSSFSSTFDSGSSSSFDGGSSGW